MIDRARAERTVAEKALGLAPGEGLRASCFKRDRSVCVLRTGEDRFVVQEDGFRKENLESDGAGLPKLLKKCFRREFPRSNKLHLDTVPAAGSEGGA